MEVVLWVFVFITIFLLLLYTARAFMKERQKLIKAEKDLKMFQQANLLEEDGHEESLKAFDRLLGVPIEVDCIEESKKEFINRWLKALLERTHRGGVDWTAESPDSFDFTNRLTQHINGTFAALVETTAGRFLVVYDRFQSHYSKCFYLCVQRQSDGLIVRELLDWNTGRELWDVAKAQAEQKVNAKSLQAILSSLD